MIHTNRIRFNNIAALLIRLGRYEEAMTYYDSTLKSNPEMGWAYRDRSYLHRSYANFDLAIQDYDRCLKMEPEIDSERAQFLGYRGTLNAYLNKHEETQKDLHASITLDRGFSFSHIALCRELMSKPFHVIKLLNDAINASDEISVPDMQCLLTARHDYFSYYISINVPGYSADQCKQYKREMMICNGASGRIS